VEAAFFPTAEEIRWARRVVAAAAGSVGLVDGAMVDRPLFERARRILGDAPLNGDLDAH
jgi:citrate lyase subunit beta/citryl-CoA lyase